MASLPFNVWYVLVAGLLGVDRLPVVAVTSLSQLEDCLNTHSPSDCTLPENLESPSGLLRIQRARITRLPAGIFRDYRDVKILDLSNNNISDIEQGTFAGMISMTKLLLTSNALETIRYTTFAGAERLKTLDLARNNIDWIEPGSFDGLRRLMLLNLNHNKLTDIPSSVYDGLPRLLYLYVDDNRVTTVSPSAFRGLQSLKILRLNQNRMEAMPNIFGDVPSLTHLGVSRNPLQCDCRIEPFRQWMRSRSTPRADSSHEPVTCVGPPDLAGTDLRFHTNILTCLRPFAIEVQNSINIDEGGYGVATPQMGGQPTPILLWQDPSGAMVPRQKGGTTDNPGEPSKDARRIFVDENGALVFSDASITDSGVYMFRAINVAGSFSSTVRVSVREKRDVGLLDVAATEEAIPILVNGLVGDKEKQVIVQRGNNVITKGECPESKLTPRFVKIIIIACFITVLVTATVSAILFYCIHKRGMRRSKTFLGTSPQTSERRHLQNAKAANYESGVSLLSSLTRISMLSNGSSVSGARRGKRSNLNSYCSGSDVAAHCSVESDPVAIVNSVDNLYDQSEDAYEHPGGHPHPRCGGLPLPPSDEAEEADGYMIPRKTKMRAPAVPTRKYQNDETYASIDVLRPPQ